MAENREEILANFQGITEIEDVAEAIFHLEETNWDLLSAINRVVPQDVSNSAASNQNLPHVNAVPVDVDMIDDDISVIKPRINPSLPIIPVDNDSVIIVPSTSSSSQSSIPPKMMEFHIHYLDRTYDLTILETATVGDLRRRISELSGVPACQQSLEGLGSLRTPLPAGTSALSSLHLPAPCNLFMTVPDNIQPDDESIAERLTQTYTLNIEYEDKTYKFQFPGTKKILEVKTDLYSFTDIPVRHQLWTGWPTSLNLDGTMLAMSGITYPEHNLKVRKAPQKPAHREYKRIIIDNSDSEQSSVEEFEDASESFTVEDDIFVDNVQSRRLEPLIPENIDDETIGCIQFAERFQDRYGPQHPIFFQGSLDNAIKEACMKPAKDRRLLGVYLHHEGSVLSNVFCAQLLGCEAVLQLLANNFIVYGWDLTFESNKNMLLSAVSNSLGSVASMTVRNIPMEKLPVLIIIMRIRSNTEIFSVINGNVSVPELLGHLIEGVERWAGKKDEETQEEKERDARNQVKWEQDEAYRQSLEADRAKEEFKKAQESAKNAERQRVESERQEADAKREAHRTMVLARLPIEPAADANSDCITKIRVRLPEGRFLERRFTADTPLRGLLDYLTVEGYPTEEFKVISSWPRRDLTAVDVEMTLLELKLCPQETVMLEER